MAKQAQTPEQKKAAQNADTFLCEVLDFYREHGGPEWSAKKRGKSDNETQARMRGLSNALTAITQRRMNSRINGTVAKSNPFASI